MAIFEWVRSFFCPDIEAPIPSIRDIEAQRLRRSASEDLTCTIRARRESLLARMKSK